jgi:large exoprotein involved in heme utilization and adhesion
LRLTDTGIFHADPVTISVLTSAPIAAFGFLGSNLGTITVQGSRLSVPTDHSLSFVAGNIAIGPGEVIGGPSKVARIAAQEGQINLVSVTSRGEVLASNFEPAPGMTGGSINLSPGTLVGVSGNAGGTVRIRGGSLVMENAAISADTVNTDGAPVAIDINVAGNLSISTVDFPALTARTTGTGNAGEIRATSGSMDVAGIIIDSFLYGIIDTTTSGQGSAGYVNITTGDLTVNAPGGPVSFIESGTSGVNPGRGGDVMIAAQTIRTENTTISTGNLAAFFLDKGGAGIAGNVTITADGLQMKSSQIVTDSSDFGEQIGRAGDITITARNFNFDVSGLSTTGSERSGAITITADHLVATSSQIQAITNQASGGAVTVTGNVIELKEGSNIASSTMGDGDAGTIIIAATDQLRFQDSGPVPRPSGIFNNSFGENGSLGNAGDVVITTPTLQLASGARINTTTATSGLSGNVTITANSVSMSGENGGLEPEPLFNLGTVQSSGIYTRTVGGNCSGPCGNAGNVSITTTDSLSMGAGAQINSGTSSSGQGGTIVINAGNTISMSGTLSTGQPGGIQSRTIGTAADAGTGGNITLTAGQFVAISDGASVSASSTGPRNAGNIQINAGQQLDMRNSSVKTEAAQASGGNIDIQAVDRVRLVNSTISTSVLGGAGSGGNITIDPNVVVLQNSNIIAQAVQGAGGNITLTTPLFLADSSSRVSASSQFGLNGTVTIQSPTSNLSESLGTLPSEPSQVHSLLTQRCAALVNNGQTSSFVVAGREQLPSDPGGWLTSPLAFVALGESLDAGLVVAAAPVTMPIAGQDTGTVSLRRLTSAGFLMANFADSEAAGCHS